MRQGLLLSLLLHGALILCVIIVYIFSGSQSTTAPPMISVALQANQKHLLQTPKIHENIAKKTLVKSVKSVRVSSIPSHTIQHEKTSGRSRSHIQKIPPHLKKMHLKKAHLVKRHNRAAHYKTSHQTASRQKVVHRQNTAPKSQKHPLIHRAVKAPKPMTPKDRAHLKSSEAKQAKSPATAKATKVRHTSMHHAATANKISPSRVEHPQEEGLRVSDLIALRNQLKACWKIPAGVHDIRAMVTKIQVYVTIDRKVADARVIWTSVPDSEPFMKIMEESAMRAIRSPACSPLILPKGKYAQWKQLILTFDPKQLLD